MDVNRAYCQLCRHRPVDDGGLGSCHLIEDRLLKSFARMWEAGLGAQPGHECPKFDPTGKRPQKEPEATEAMF